MASDSAATFAADGGATIGQQSIQKIVRVNDSILYASTGAVGIAQIIADFLHRFWTTDKGLAGVVTPDAAMDKIGKQIAILVEPYLRTAQMQRQVTGRADTSLCRSLIALPVNHQPFLFQFDYNGAPERATKDLPFVAIGSGQPIADPFLAFLKRLFWADHEPTLAEGRFAAIWAIDHVRRTNPGGVSGDIQLATLTVAAKTPSVIIATPDDVQEHYQKVGAAEAALQAHVKDAPSGVAVPPRP